MSTQAGRVGEGMGEGQLRGEGFLFRVMKMFKKCADGCVTVNILKAIEWVIGMAWDLYLIKLLKTTQNKTVKENPI